jgi:hypothetical protein
LRIVVRHFAWTILISAASALPARAQTDSPPVAYAAQRGVGEIVLAEGLAMRIAHRRFPDRRCTEIRPSWFAEAAAKRTQILRDVRAALNDSDRPTVTALTTGVGPAGIEREASYAAWIVTGYLLAHGETYAEIAAVNVKDAPARVGEAIDKMLLEAGR